MRRTIGLAVLGLLLVLPVLGHTDDDFDLRLEGVVDVPPTGPGGTLVLPLAPGSPAVTVLFNFGLPTVQLAVTIGPSTAVKAERPLPVTLGDGDRVRVKLAVVNGGFVATELKVRRFPEVKLGGVVQGLPAAGLTLPLPAGSIFDFTVNLGVVGADVPVRATEDTKVEEGPLTLMNGDHVVIEGFVQNFQIILTEISGPEGDEEGEEGED